MFPKRDGYAHLTAIALVVACAGESSVSSSAPGAGDAGGNAGSTASTGGGSGGSNAVGGSGAGGSGGRSHDGGTSGAPPGGKSGGAPASGGGTAQAGRGGSIDAGTGGGIGGAAAGGTGARGDSGDSTDARSDAPCVVHVCGGQFSVRQCGDCIDNDGDQLIDLDDPDCHGDPCWPGEKPCSGLYPCGESDQPPCSFWSSSLNICLTGCCYNAGP
jgi:hypothetical protein